MIMEIKFLITKITFTAVFGWNTAPHRQITASEVLAEN